VCIDPASQSIGYFVTSALVCQTTGTTYGNDRPQDVGNILAGATFDFYE
jgi:hypothetical protein